MSDFKPRVSATLPRGFRSVKLNLPTNSAESSLDVNNNTIGTTYASKISNNSFAAPAGPPPPPPHSSNSQSSTLQPGIHISRSRSPTQNNQPPQPRQPNSLGLYSKQTSSISPPPVPPPPSSGLQQPIYLQPYEVPTTELIAEPKPFWTLPESEQHQVLQQLSRSPSPVVRPQSVEPEQIEHVITDREPPADAQFLYETDSHRFYSVPTGSGVQRITQTTSGTQTQKTEGIGPVNESGVPVALRTGVRDEYASDWYKTMFKNLHKADKPRWMEEEPVTIKVPKKKSSKKDFKLDSYNEDDRRSRNENRTDKTEKYTEANQYRRYQEEERRKNDLYKDSAFLAEEPNSKYVIKKKKSQKSKSPVPKKMYASVQRGEEIPFAGLGKPVPVYRPRGFYEQKQQEQVLFTPTQSPLPPVSYAYEQNSIAPTPPPIRQPSPPIHSQALASTSPGFSLHSIDEWQRRMNEDLNQIYCTIRRNQEVTRLRESGRLVSPQPQQRPRSSQHLYQTHSQPPTSRFPYSTTSSQSYQDSTFATQQYRSQQNLMQIPLEAPPTLPSSSLISLQPALPTIVPVPPVRPVIALHASYSDLAVPVQKQQTISEPTNTIALYAVPNKKRTLIEQTYYDRERFDRPELVQPISLERQWSQSQLDTDWSQQQQQSTKAHSEFGIDSQSYSSRPEPLQRFHSHHTSNSGNRFAIQNSRSAFDPPSLRASASLGNLHQASSLRSPLLNQPVQPRLQPNKSNNSVILAQDVNNVNFLQQDEEDDLDKLIKKIEQDAIIQDELDSYNTTQIYQTPVLNKVDPNFRNDVNHNRFLLQKYYEQDHSKIRPDEFDLPRRHHYSPNPDSVVHLNRFEQAYREKEGAEIRQKLFAKVLRDFRAVRENEISVKKGDIVIISRPIDHNWLEIEDTSSGLKGLVPRRYLDLEQEGMATAKFDFYGRPSNNEISLRKGEAVKVIRQVDENWFRGVNSRGDVGIFPCSYVEMLKKPLTEELHINFLPGSESPLPPSAHSPSHLSPQTCSVTRTLPANTVKQALSLSSTPAESTRRQRPLKMYRVLFNYQPQQADELELIAGDMIEVSLECDDGWFVGRASLTGKIGTFPGNYVERLL